MAPPVHKDQTIFHYRQYEVIRVDDFDREMSGLDGYYIRTRNDFVTLGGLKALIFPDVETCKRVIDHACDFERNMTLAIENAAD